MLVKAAVGHSRGVHQVGDARALEAAEAQHPGAGGGIEEIAHIDGLALAEGVQRQDGGVPDGLQDYGFRIRQADSRRLSEGFSGDEEGVLHLGCEFPGRVAGIGSVVPVHAEDVGEGKAGIATAFGGWLGGRQSG